MSAEEEYLRQSAALVQQRINASLRAAKIQRLRETMDGSSGVLRPMYREDEVQKMVRSQELSPLGQSPVGRLVDESPNVYGAPSLGLDPKRALWFSMLRKAKRTQDGYMDSAEVDSRSFSIRE